MSDLPIEYIPLSHSNLETDMEFGPIEFVVKPNSHEESRKLLVESDLDRETKIETSYLFPSEMWGWARVFSRYFGRLNEVAVSRAEWEIYGEALPNEVLTSHSRIASVHSRNGLPFATSETITKNQGGMVLVRCIDELLLLHDVNKKFYQERGKESSKPANPSYQRTRKVYFRHDWESGKWVNNIHTDEYPQRFGYERGLPEFIMYMDWIFLTQLEQFGEDAYNHRTIDIQKILPIYKDEVIQIFGQKRSQHYDVQFFRRNQERLEAVVKAGTL